MSSHDPHYEPPAVEVMPTQDGPTVTAAGDSPVYGAITLMDDDGKPRRRGRRPRILRRKRPSGE